MQIELTERERGLIAAMLQRELAELPVEIRRTQTSTYRDDLKEQEQVLRGVYSRLSHPKRATA